MVSLDASEVIAEHGIAYFQAMSTFGALSEGFIRDVLEAGQIDQLHKKDYITRAGEPAEEFHVILEGEVAYYRHG